MKKSKGLTINLNQFDTVETLATPTKRLIPCPHKNHPNTKYKVFLNDIASISLSASRIHPTFETIDTPRNNNHGPRLNFAKAISRFNQKIPEIEETIRPEEPKLQEKHQRTAKEKAKTQLDLKRKKQSSFQDHKLPTCLQIKRLQKGRQMSSLSSISIISRAKVLASHEEQDLSYYSKNGVNYFLGQGKAGNTNLNSEEGVEVANRNEKLSGHQYSDQKSHDSSSHWVYEEEEEEGEDCDPFALKGYRVNTTLKDRVGDESMCEFCSQSMNEGVKFGGDGRSQFLTKFKNKFEKTKKH